MNSRIPHRGERALVLAGGGGHALVVLEAAALSGWQPMGFYDDSPDAVVSDILPRLGTLADFERTAGTLPAHAIVALGDVRFRARACAATGARWATVAHPGALISPSAAIGRGVFIGAGAIVQARADIGDHVILNSGCIVEHECRIGAGAHLAPGSVLGGRVVVGRQTLVGLGSRVLPGVSIDDGATVGAGAVVTRRVEGRTTVVGCPARPVGPLIPSKTCQTGPNFGNPAVR